MKTATTTTISVDPTWVVQTRTCTPETLQNDDSMAGKMKTTDYTAKLGACNETTELKIEWILELKGMRHLNEFIRLSHFKLINSCAYFDKYP